MRSLKNLHKSHDVLIFWSWFSNSLRVSFLTPSNFKLDSAKVKQTNKQTKYKTYRHRQTDRQTGNKQTKEDEMKRGKNN